MARDRGRYDGLGCGFLVVALLAIASAPDTLHAACGGDGERGCCVGCGEAGPSCDSGLVEVSGCSGNCDCGGDVCKFFGFKSTTTCKQPTPCGREGERACCTSDITGDSGTGAFGSGCRSGLIESSSPKCRDTALGDDGCLCSEFLFAPIYSAGVCVAETPCGGPDERACCVFEKPSIGACEDGLIQNGKCRDERSDAECVCDNVLGSNIYSEGICREPTCGGEGQRGCCLLERIPSCDSGLIEDLSPGCESVLGSGNCDCGFGLGKSLGVCREKKAVGEKGCSAFDPCQSGAKCMSIDFGETICVPEQNDGVFGNDVCAAFYSPTVHATAMESGATLTFGIGGSVSFVTTGSVEGGVAYAADGCYGCYYTTCYGIETDVSISGAACVGVIYDGLWGSVAGDSCAATVSVDLGLIDLGASFTEAWAGDGLDDCFSDPTPEAQANCFSIGLGLNPLPVGGSLVLCNTVTNLVACVDDAVSGDGDLILTPDELPTCTGADTLVACPGSSVPLTALAIDPDGDTLSYDWSTDCANATFDSKTKANPTLSFDPDVSCAALNCEVSLTVSGTDPDGNTTGTSCAATIVNDTSAPIYSSFPVDVTLECGADTGTAANGSPAADDSCGGGVTISSSDSMAADCGDSGVITRTWTASDSCGNGKVAEQIITVVDNTAPSIDTGASDKTVECDGAGNVSDRDTWLGSNGGGAASDACGTVAWSNDFTALSDGCGGTGSAAVTFTAADQCGFTKTTSATFTVEDKTDPTLTCPTVVYHESPAGSCTDSVSYSVTASDACGSASIVCTADSGGASSVTETGGSFPVGTTNVTCTATDECSLTSGCSFVVVVNDPPQITSISLGTQSVQYSDKIVPVVVTATDCGPGSSLTLEFDAADVPAGLALSSTADSCALNGSNLVECTWTLDNDDRVLAPEGTYVIDNIKGVDPTPLDGMTLKSSPAESITVEVAAENAAIAFDSGNPVAVQVATDGGNSGAFDLIVDVQELLPERASAGGNLPGDIGLAVMSMTLAPVGPGGSATGTCTPDNDPAPFDYTGVLTVTCSFNDVPVNTYTIEAVLVANASGEKFYAGFSEDVLVVFDPSMGFTTGGGTFAWPGTGDRTNWGYTMKYNNKQTNIQGSLLLIRHLPDGTNYRIKSNALYGLAIGDEAGFGWASFAGKCTYRDPSMVEPIGNHEFVTYVEDHGKPGAGVDAIWLQLLDKDRLLIGDLSMSEPATGNTVLIDGGNIVVPHQPDATN